MPSDGAWVDFTVTGENSSSNVDDAVIEAKAGNTLLADEDMTVFYFAPSDITVALGHSYTLQTVTIEGKQFKLYAPTDGVGVNFNSSAVIKPTGVDCDAPQIADIVISIVQNVQSATDIAFYRNPGSPTFHNGNTSATIPTEVTRTSSITTPMLDVADGEEGPLMRDSHVNEPTGCPEGGSVQSNDTPLVYGKSSEPITFKDQDGNDVVTVYYTLEQVTMDDEFRIWCVTYNPNDTGNEVIPLRQSSWSLDVDSGGEGSQLATVPSGDSAVSAIPVITGDIANSVGFGPFTAGTETVMIEAP